MIRPGVRACTSIPYAARMNVAIGAQAFLASQLGLAVGARIGEVWRERAERLAGVMLIVLGAGLIVAQVVG
jgi:putative Mn2+ efflux pump MntP